MQYGHFDNEKREYVIDRVALPVSWTNYLGVKDLCVVVNHTAGGYMFYQSPEYHRVTRFRGNAVPMDRPGHYVYLRDAEDGDYWSISWQPVGKPLNQAKYTCRHGMSYTTYECDYKGIKASQTLMVPMDDAVELWDVRLKNTTDKERRLSVFSYCEFSFHHIMIDNQNFQMSLYCAGSSYDENIIEYDLFYEEFGYQYFASNVTPDGFDCLRDSFLGAYRTEDNPIAVECGTCSGSHELGNNHCGSLQKDLVLAPGEEVRLIFMLGEGSREAGKKIREKYSDMANVDAAYAQLREYWENKFAQLQIRTPNEGMNTLINTWNLYQAEVNIMFSRFASFIEVGGRTGLGYRDTAQDAMTIPHSNPEKCRQRIVELLRGLTTKGYGLHLFSPEWFDPDAKKEKKKPFKSPTVIPTVNAKDIVHGLEDACSDDALWLVPSIIEYIKETGETGFADETVTYADGGEGTVYEHMKRILDFSAEQVGATGICKGLRADWNDCLNLNCFSEEPGESFQTFGPSEGPNAESVFIAGMFVKYGKDYVKICRHKGLCDEADTAQKAIKQMEKTVMDAGWMASGIFVLTTTTSTRLVPRNVRMEKSLLNHRAFVLSLKSERMKGSALRQCSLLKNILILNMALCSCSRLTTDIMWSLVKSLLIHRDTRRTPASSATTILGFL